MDTVEKVLDLQIPQKLRLSPDGTKVVYSTNLAFGHKKGDARLSSIWVADVGKEKSARQLTSGLHNDKNPVWSSTSDSIFFTSDRKQAGQKIGLYEMSLSGGEPVLLTNSDYDQPIVQFAISPNGKYLAFLKSDERTPEKKAKDEAKDDAQVYGEDWDYGRLWLMHLGSRLVEAIVTGSFHITDFAWSPKSSSIAYTVQSSPEGEVGLIEGTNLHKIDLASKKTSLVSECKYRPPEDGSRLQWAGDKIYHVANSIPGPKFSSDVVVGIPASGGDWHIEVGGETYCGADFHACGDSIIAKAKNDLYDELRSPSDEIYYREFSAITQFHAVPSPSDPSKPIIALVKSTINQPPEVYTLTPSDSTPIQLSAHGSALPNPSIATAHQVHIACPSDTTITIDALLLTPGTSPTAPAKPYPTFINPHGGPYSRVTNAFTIEYGWPSMLLRAGYAVLCPNYRGSSSHGRAYAGPHQAGTADYADVIALTDHAVKQGWADPARLIIGGWSGGGYLSFLAAVRNGTHGLGWRFRGAIGGAGVSDWDAMALTSDQPDSLADNSGGLPWMQGKESVASRSGSALWEFAEAAKEGRIPPVLVLHGEGDDRVPVSQGWGFQRACRKWGVQCRMVTYPREGHGFGERKHIVDLFGRVLEFCDTHFES